MSQQTWSDINKVIPKQISCKLARKNGPSVTAPFTSKGVSSSGCTAKTAYLS